MFNASKFRSLKEIRNQSAREKMLTEIGKTKPGYFSEDDEFYFDPVQFRSVLHSAVDQLPIKCKEIFLLSKNEKLSNKDIAEKLNISVKTVENQMTIALKKLRTYLEPYRGKIFILFLFHLLS